ncbi:Site-specific recombinase XerD [Vannielia litorea]|uniref:Site-specific recombinase XerD n=2 Tax=Vannielia litorea TaxID=1217970 RepID=A0A1N6GVX0_9RHOB|nr:Site-specific recombinase XerD [Vannielia litorea]
MPIRFSKLTRPAIRSLQRGASISEHGITFRRDGNGDGVYSVNIMVDRRRIHRVIGRESEGVTRQQAEDFIAQARTDARRQRLELPEGRKTPLSFEEAADRYVQRLRDSDGKNIDIKERQLRQHLVPFLAAKPLSAIESFDVERYKKARRSAGAAKATVNRDLATLSHLLNQAVEWKWIKSKSVRINRFKEDNQRIVYLTDDQCVALLDAAASDHNENVHAFVMVGLHTGMRHAEILKIRREDVDVGKRVIWVPRAKAGSREQPITRELADYLRKRMEMLPPGCEWLFPSLGSATGHVHTIRKAFRRSAERAGLDPDQITPHTLRHTAVTHLVQAGVDLPTVQRISGHKTLSMVARYAHQSGSHIEAAMDRLEGRVSGTYDDNIRKLKPKSSA